LKQAGWRNWVALAAAFAGTCMLAGWYRSYSPEAGWPVISRSQLISSARQVAQHFGVSTSALNVYVTPRVSMPLANYAKQHPGAQDLSPLSVRIAFVPPQDGPSAEVGLDSSGRLVYWRAPQDYKSPQKFGSDDLAAQAAFQFMAGAQAGSYKEPVRSAGDEAHEDDYQWKQPAPAKSGLRETIKVVAKDSAIETAERTNNIGEGEDDDDFNTGDDRKYWTLFSGVIGLTCTAGVILVLGIYILWLARKALNHQFPLRVAGVLGVFAVSSMAWGLEHENLVSHEGTSRNVHIEQVFVSFFTIAMIACCIAVGRGISTATRTKWISMEQLCRLAPVSKSTGASLAAGLLFSPLLLALPYLTAASGLFRDAWLLPQNARVLYGRIPLLDSISIEHCAYLVGFFGFGLPAAERLIRTRWLRWCMVLPVGVFFFGDMPRAISGPVLAPLMVGFLTLALFWFVWAQFDMLAILTLEVGSGLLLSLFLLMQKAEAGWSLMAGIGAIAALAVWCGQRKQTVAVGDPLVSYPMLIGFRNEREQLRAEFSVARRAQQEMLPQNPPHISGYTIAASCTPSLEVGGDLYDFLRLKDGRIGIGVADVSGKGVPAALYMTLTKGLLSAVTKSTCELSKVVEEVNRHLHGVTRKKVFVTMALGFLDIEKKLLQCVRAGHNPVVWRQTSRNLTTLVAPGGLGLGITASRVFGTQLKIAEMQLSAGDAVVFYSDGITEAMNSELEQFGEQRLMEAVEKTDKLDAAMTRDSILTDVRAFLAGVHPQDDMTIVVLRVGSS
jgi:hypothetical protein